MKQKTLSVLIKLILTGFSLTGIALYIAAAIYGKDLAAANLEYSHAYVPWLVFLAVSLLPCYAVVALGWQIAGSISLCSAFTLQNSKRLRVISIIALCDSAFYVAANILLLLLNMSHPGVCLGGLLIAFTGCAIAVAAQALSALTAKASDIREENELTI